MDDGDQFGVGSIVKVLTNNMLGEVSSLVYNANDLYCLVKFSTYAAKESHSRDDLEWIGHDEQPYPDGSLLTMAESPSVYQCINSKSYYTSRGSRYYTYDLLQVKTGWKTGGIARDTLDRMGVQIATKLETPVEPQIEPWIADGLTFIG